MKKLGIVLLIVALLAGITGAAYFGVIAPYRQAETAFLSGAALVITPQNAQNWLLEWQSAAGADGYQVELQRGGNPVFRDFTDGQTQLSIPALPSGEECAVVITPEAHYSTIFGKKLRSGVPITVRGDFTLPTVSMAQPETDGIAHTLRVQVQPSDQYRWRLYSGDALLDESESASGEQLWDFSADYPLPGEGQTLRLEVTPLRETDSLLLYGLNTSSADISAETLRIEKFFPILRENQKNTPEISWSPIQGASGYALESRSGDGWETLKTFAPEDTLSYSRWLPAGEEICWRVSVLGGHGEVLFSSDELTFTAGDMVLYATVFPTQDLPVYRDGAVVAHAKACSPYCVLEESGGQFLVRADGETGWINSSLCMINLPEYLGGLCSYNITNSVYSIYTVHEFAIPGVTGEVTAGYENVAQQDGGFLVPLLYPTAKKLYTAALTAQAQGLRLKIYDSFRPYAATRAIYDITKEILNDPLPEATFTGVPKSTLELPAPRPGTDTLTYGWLMTGSNFVLASFLAEKGSAHNLGIALDLTLETLDTGEELQMQTTIHDLSHYSILSENNENADRLGSIMLPAGFSGLMSEWWHFQDNDAKADLPLVQVYGGVTAEGWIRDAGGWRYRNAKGAYLAGQSVTLGSSVYAFRDDGYLIE